jgi:hypothetical protein
MFVGCSVLFHQLFGPFGLETRTSKGSYLCHDAGRYDNEYAQVVQELIAQQKIKATKQGDCDYVVGWGHHFTKGDAWRTILE